MPSRRLKRLITFMAKATHARARYPAIWVKWLVLREMLIPAGSEVHVKVIWPLSYHSFTLSECWLSYLGTVNVHPKVNIRELQKPLQRQRQARQEFAYLTIKNHSFARFARALSILYVSQSFWSYQRREMACFSIIHSTATKTSLKINISEMMTILWSLRLPRILYCRQCTLQMDW